MTYVTLGWRKANSATLRRRAILRAAQPASST
jgi:hypothetical protein